MNEKRIVVSIRDGAIAAVYSFDTDVEVLVVDHDAYTETVQDCLGVLSLSELSGDTLERIQLYDSGVL
jgi:hypothetical protein